MKDVENITFKNKLSKRIINTPTNIAKNTFFYVQETGCMKKEELASTKRDGLDSYLIVAVVSGSGQLSIGKNSYSVSKGECFFIDCHDVQLYKGDKNDPWEIMWVHFNSIIADKYYSYFLQKNKNVFKPYSMERVISLINAIINNNEHKNFNTEIINSKLIVELLTELLIEPPDNILDDNSIRPKIRAVYDFITENFGDEITLDMLANKFYISKYYLTREFKKIYGKTIFQHLITTRINYGKELLRFTNKSVEEISNLCGFNDQSYFIRQFKKTENITCFAYRKNWKD